MSSSFAPASLRETLLFQRLERPFATVADPQLATSLVVNLPDVCRIAVDRMKAMPVYHPEFTLHDDVHLLRVTQLMGMIIPQEVLEHTLNPVEIALLILAAHFHDVGMIPEAAELDGIRESDEFRILRSDWLLEHSGLREAVCSAQLASTDEKSKRKAIEISSVIESETLSRFLRRDHAKRSAQIVRTTVAADPRLKCGTGHLCDALAILCESHNQAPEFITPANGFYYDKGIGTWRVNMSYLATVLRLADILDFDRERTPDELFRSLSIGSNVSIVEWEKHRSVEAWSITKDEIRFDCSCEHPEYELAIRKFLDWIDVELAAARDAIRCQPAAFTQYKIDLPARTDRSRIGPKNGCYLSATNLAISLSRNEILNLFMTDKLYGQPSLAVRELLQNGWDALRHRAALFKSDEGQEWESGKVSFVHGVNEDGREFVRCQDNGVGMDEHVICNFLVQAGKSYYRSPEFERERSKLRTANADFDPCAQFGIGFMSLFMLGDDITIHTRRYRGSKAGQGDPLIVEIRGVGGLIVLKRGHSDQPCGTTIEVVGRKRPPILAGWNDKVRLCQTLYEYALAGEFPVDASCTIPELQEEMTIPPGVHSPWHPIQDAKVNGIIFKQEFADVDPMLQGTIICGLPLDLDGNLTVRNSDCGWQADEKDKGRAYFHCKEEKYYQRPFEGQTCLDGILVAGAHGRSYHDHGMIGTTYPNPVGIGADPFVLDVRGALKPELSPSRGPLEGRGLLYDRGPRWRKLRSLVGKAHGKLWGQVLRRFSDDQSILSFWQLASLHGVDFSCIHRGLLWEKLRIPLIGDNGAVRFQPFEGLPPISFADGEQDPTRCQNGETIGIGKEGGTWLDINEGDLVRRASASAILALGKLDLTDLPKLVFSKPSNPFEYGERHVLIDGWDRPVNAMEFADGWDDVLAANVAKRLINCNHRVVRWLGENSMKNMADDPVATFLHTLVVALAEQGVLEAFASESYNDGRSNWHFVLLGHTYLQMDPEKLPEEARPPYKCWTPTVGLFDITHDHLRSLAKVKVIDWWDSRSRRRMPL